MTDPTETTDARRLRHQIIIDLEVGDDPEGVFMLVENLLYPRGIGLISVRSVPECTSTCEDDGEELVLRIDSGLMAWLRALVAGPGFFGDLGETAVYLLRTALLKMMEEDVWYGAAVPHLPEPTRTANMQSPKYQALEAMRATARYVRDHSTA